MASTIGRVTVSLSPVHVQQANVLVERLSLGARMLRDDPTSPSVVHGLRRSNGTVAGRKPMPRLTAAGRQAVALKVVALAGLAAWNAAEASEAGSSAAASCDQLEAEPSRSDACDSAEAAEQPERGADAVNGDAAALRDALAEEEACETTLCTDHLAMSTQLSTASGAYCSPISQAGAGGRERRTLSGHKRPRPAAHSGSSLLERRLLEACMGKASCPLPPLLALFH